MRLLKKLSLLSLALTTAFLWGCSASDRVVKTYEGPSLAEEQLAKLVTREDIRIIEIDGVKQQEYLLNNLALTYDLLPGEHIIAYQYRSIWARKKQSDDSDEPSANIAESGLRQVRMVFQPGQTYSFEFAKPSSFREAQAFAQNFSATLVDGNGRMVARDSAYGTAAVATASKQPSASNQVAVKPVPSPDLKREAVASAAPVAATTLPNTTLPNAEVSAAMEAPSVVTPVEAGLSRLDAIKVLWTKATAEEKKEFLRWAFQ